MTTGVNGVQIKDLQNLAYAATGAAINRTNSTEELVQFLGFGGAVMALPTALKAGKGLVWDLPKWGYQNWGNYRPALNNVWQNSMGQTNLYSANRAALKGNFWSTVNNQSLKTQLRGLNLPTFANGSNEAHIYRDVNKLVKEIETNNLKGKDLAKQIEKIKTANTKAKIELNKAKAANQVRSKTKIGKAASWVKTKSGVRALENKVLEGTLSSNKAVRTIAKGAKAGGGMFVISAAIEAPNVVKTYKELGAGKGTKQLAKSTAVVAAETVGYVAGAKVGGVAGAKIGATIGTCIGGPVGTAIGGAVGTIIGVGCGLLGCWLAGKGARAVVGKDELTLAKEQQAEELAQEAKNDTEKQVALALAAKENLETGNVSSEEDANDIIESFNNVVTKIEENSYQTTEPQDQSGYYFGKTTQRNYSTDAGLQALFNLANNNISGAYDNQFNSYSSIFMNPFMFNPYMTSYMNPFAMNYLNPFMYNPYMMQQNFGFVA